MQHRLRSAILFAATLLHSACSADERSGNPAAGDDADVTAGANDRAPVRALKTKDGPAMTEDRILISSDRGRVTAQLVDNETTRALVRMLPVTIEMRDHLRQEKTGVLPAPLPDVQRQVEFSAGTLGLWGNEDFVIYYRKGRVPRPGIVVLGRVTGDLSVFDRPGFVTVRVERAD